MNSAVYAALSVALGYPEEGQLERVTALLAADGAPASEAADGLRRFVSAAGDLGLTERQRRYVATFDLARSSGLYLTHYLHGERRERGMALLRLRHRYAMSGLQLDPAELPDHLAVLLEFASHDPAGGAALLEEFHVPLLVLRQRLREAASDYTAVLDAVLAVLPPGSSSQREAARTMQAGPPPTELVGLEPFAPPEVMPPAAGAREGAG